MLRSTAGRVALALLAALGFRPAGGPPRTAPQSAEAGTPPGLRRSRTTCRSPIRRARDSSRRSPSWWPRTGMPSWNMPGGRFGGGSSAAPERPLLRHGHPGPRGTRHGRRDQALLSVGLRLRDPEGQRARHQVTGRSRLKKLKIGVNLLNSDAENTPPAMALSRYGVVGNLTGFRTFYTDEDRPEDIVNAVAKNDMDVAIVWGPLAGYFAKKSPVPLGPPRWPSGIRSTTSRSASTSRWVCAAGTRISKTASNPSSNARARDPGHP